MKQLIPAVSDTKQPGNGFYTFVNEKWLNSHHIPSWRGEFDVSDEMTNETDKELLHLLHNLPQNHSINLNPKTASEHLQTFGHLWKHKTVEGESSYLQVCIHDLIGYKTESDIAKFLGWMVRCSIPTILNIGAREEIIKPYLVRATLSSGNLLLPLEYYLNSNKSSDVWKAYEEFISTCSIELGLPFLYKAIQVETELASILKKPYYHVAITKRGSSLKSWIQGFEWSGFMEGLDLDSKWERRLWVINSPERLKGVLMWLYTKDKESILSLLAIHLIRFAASYLKPSIHNAYDKLYQTALRGVTSVRSYELRMLNDVQAVLPEALCSLYSKYHKDKKLLNNIKLFTSSLQESAIDLMDKTDSLSKKTMSQVKEKLHRMRFVIGKEKEDSLPNVRYNPDSLLHTILSINSERTYRITSFTGSSANKMHASYPCFITNASYFEESNHITIPWGILQWPFYDIEAPLGWNHGGIGATICHEMVHGFDLEGSLYSPKGAYKEWWTRKNRSTFKKQTRKVSGFFSQFKHYGKKLNGRKTLSENWADLGGLKISLHGLNRELDRMKATMKERKEAHRNFFISYAVSWRGLYKKKELLFTMLESVHSPGEDRVDRIVPQFQEWVDAFDIKETDHLFLPIQKRLKFF